MAVLGRGDSYGVELDAPTAITRQVTGTTNPHSGCLPAFRSCFTFGSASWLDISMVSTYQQRRLTVGTDGTARRDLVNATISVYGAARPADTPSHQH